MDSEGLYQLIKKAQHSEEAMYKLILQFDPLIRKLARHLEEKPQDRCDAEQEIRLEIIKAVQHCKLEKFPENEAFPLISYIEKSANHRYLQLLGKKYAAPEACSSDLEYEQSSAPDFPVQEMGVELSDLLDRLTARQRQAIIGYYCYGYSDQELADRLHVSRQAVYKNRVRALKLLKKQL